MRITEVSLVSVTARLPDDRGKGDRRTLSTGTHRAFPIHRYPDIARTLDGTPGRSTSRAWVRVTVEDGTWGIGPCDWANLAGPIITDVYAPLLVGRDVFATELLNDLMWRTAHSFGSGGLASIARSAVDIALWDTKGKVLDQPVHRLLGGPVLDRLPAYATTDDLEWALELGFRAVKLTNPTHAVDGSRGLDLLEEHVGRARELVGSDVELMLNPVMSFDVEYGARVADRLRPFDLRWIEEPLMPHEVTGHAELRAAFSPTPLATGEHLHGRHAFAALIAARGADIIQPDVLWCGGVTETMRIASLAEADGLATIPHFSGSTAYGMQVSAALTECPLVEFWLTSDPGVPLDRVGAIPGTPVPSGGYLSPSGAPGMGYDLSADDLLPWSNP